MRTHTLYASGLMVALLIAVGGFFASESRPSMVAFAQDATTVPTTATQDTSAVQNAQPVERDNNFPWGLLGLLGLAGLAGLRPRPEPVRREPMQSTTQAKSNPGTYDTPRQ
jgi:MYXO-CTERM domain-containing protein